MNDIRTELMDNEKWPSLDDTDHLGELNSIADEAFNKHTLEGYLASLLIYHQLCEEMVKLLIRDSEFLIRSRVYPVNISFQEKKRLMFGRAIEQLKGAVDFYEKENFIKKCEEFNQLRNSVVHKLTKNTTTAELQEKMREMQDLFNDIYYLWDNCHEWFRENIKETKKFVESFYD